MDHDILIVKWLDGLSIYLLKDHLFTRVLNLRLGQWGRMDWVN